MEEGRRGGFRETETIDTPLNAAPATKKAGAGAVLQAQDLTASG